MDAAITPNELKQLAAAFPPPAVVDVRRQRAFDADPETIPGSLRRLPETVSTWAEAIEPWRPVVVCCAHGHEVGRDTAAALRALGLAARYVDGGLERWRAEGNPTRRYAEPTRWVTRERPKIDRIACPWLVRRFIDPAAEFFFVPNAEVRAFAAANRATAFDIPDAPYSHDGDACSFDAFLRRHRLDDPALAALATIVRGADTAALHLAAQAPGLLAVSLGLSAMFADDRAILKWGMLVYDALYAWCRDAHGEAHGWHPEKLRVPEPGSGLGRTQ